MHKVALTAIAAIAFGVATASAPALARGGGGGGGHIGGGGMGHIGGGMGHIGGGMGHIGSGMGHLGGGGIGHIGGGIGHIGSIAGMGGGRIGGLGGVGVGHVRGSGLGHIGGGLPGLGAQAMASDHVAGLHHGGHDHQHHYRRRLGGYGAYDFDDCLLASTQRTMAALLLLMALHPARESMSAFTPSAIGTKRTCRRGRSMSAFWVTADIIQRSLFRKSHPATISIFGR